MESVGCWSNTIGASDTVTSMRQKQAEVSYPDSVSSIPTFRTAIDADMNSDRVHL